MLALRHCPVPCSSVNLMDLSIRNRRATPSIVSYNSTYNQSSSSHGYLAISTPIQASYSAKRVSVSAWFGRDDDLADTAGEEEELGVSPDVDGAQPASLGENSPSKDATIDIKLPRRNLLARFTCGVCGERSERLINRLAYERGLVYVQCAGCQRYHKLADNLGLVVEHDFRGQHDLPSQ